MMDAIELSLARIVTQSETNNVIVFHMLPIECSYHGIDGCCIYFAIENIIFQLSF